MQVSNEVNWGGTDCAVFGAMLAVAAGTCERAPRMTREQRLPSPCGIAVAAACDLVWMNLAVGVIRTEDSPLNVLYA